MYLNLTGLKESILSKAPEIVVISVLTLSSETTDHKLLLGFPAELLLSCNSCVGTATLIPTFPSLVTLMPSSPPSLLTHLSLRAMFP